MLILTRRPQEAIYIGDTIKVTISSIKGNLIRIRTASPELLVVTRKVGETINIGKDISVTPLSIKGMQVRLGIEAPKDISVHREEIYERIQAGKAQQIEKVTGAA